MNIFRRYTARLSRPSSGRSGLWMRGSSLLLASLTALTGLYSCQDWDDHYDSSGVEGSNTTLWQQIEQRPELSDFAAVLKNTMVFRQHKKTSVSYADLLDGGQSLTVFAPVNGTFNRDSLIALTQTARGDSAVEVFFVKNHLSSTLYSVVDESRTIRMLNGKRVLLEKNGAAGVEFSGTNVRGKNGVLHVVKTNLPYTFTVYESLTQLEQFKAPGDVLLSYNEDEFNEDASVSSGLVDGIPVYVDSVLYERNKLIEAIGLLNAEDSVYYVAVPTSEGWQRAWDKAAGYFRYSAAVDKGDSLQHYWTSRALMDDAVFSRTVQASMQDSVKSKFYDPNTPEYHVFYRPFDSDGLFGKAQGVVDCSNGYLYYYDEWPLTPVQTYFKKIEQEAEDYWNILTYDKCNYNSRSLNADSISKNAYLDIVPTGGTVNWNVTYKLSNTLAGEYDFCVVVLPKTVEGPNGNMRPNKFKVTVNYIDEEGNAQKYDCGGTSFTNDPAVVDTIVVAEKFKLPACNFNQNNDKVSLTISCNISNRENSKYNREMYLDAIFLRPCDN